MGKVPNETPRGDVRYDAWLERHVGEYFRVHMAFAGDCARTGLPLWDRAVAVFEELDGCRGEEGAGGDHAAAQQQVSWDHFGKALRRAGVAVEPRALQRLVDHLDPEMTGEVAWTALCPRAPAAPYFFQGARDRAARLASRNLVRDFGEVENLQVSRKGAADFVTPRIPAPRRSCSPN